MPATGIRPASPKDARGIAIVHVAAWQWAYAGLLPQAAIDERTFERRLATWTGTLGAADGAERVLVADDGAIRGFAAYGRARDGEGAVGELYALYVDPALVGTGVGGELHDRALDELRLAGYTNATLWVLDTNARALAFYARRGWQQAGPKKAIDFAGETRVEVQLAKALG